MPCNWPCLFMKKSRSAVILNTTTFPFLSPYIWVLIDGWDSLMTILVSWLWRLKFKRLVCRDFMSDLCKLNLHLRVIGISDHQYNFNVAESFGIWLDFSLWLSTSLFSESWSTGLDYQKVRKWHSESSLEFSKELCTKSSVVLKVAS